MRAGALAPAGSDLRGGPDASRWPPAASLGLAVALLAALGLRPLGTDLQTLVVGGLVAAIASLLLGPALAVAVPVALASKPLVDLAWRWKFGTVAMQEINLQSLFGLLPIALLATALITRPARLVWAVSPVVLVLAACLAVSLTPSAWALNELIRLISNVSWFFLAGIYLDRASRLERVARWFLAAVAVPVVLSYGQLAGLLPYEFFEWRGYELGRVSGTYPHPADLTYFLVYAIPLALHLFARSRSLAARCVYLAFVAASLPPLYFTYHRTSLLAIALQLVLWVILSRSFVALVVVLAGGALTIGLLHEPLAETFELLFDSARVSWSDPGFLHGRGINFYVFLHAWSGAHPLYWLVGRGGSEAAAFVPNWGYFYSPDPHNDFIRVLHAYGLLGFGSFLFFVGMITWHSMRLRRSSDGFRRGLGRLTVVCVAAYLLLSMTTSPSRFPSASWYFYALASAVVVQARKARAESLERP